MCECEFVHPILYNFLPHSFFFFRFLFSFSEKLFFASHLTFSEKYFRISHLRTQIEWINVYYPLWFVRRERVCVSVCADLFPTKFWSKQASWKRKYDEIRREYKISENECSIFAHASHDHVSCEGFCSPTKYKINFESHRWHWCISCMFPATSWFMHYILVFLSALTAHIYFRFFVRPFSLRLFSFIVSAFVRLNAWLLQ